jgi:acyl carrier protein
MTTFDQVKQILVERFAADPAKIQPETNLQTELKLDSIDGVDLLMIIQEVFGVRIPDKVFEEVHTVGQLAKAIERKKSVV